MWIWARVFEAALKPRSWTAGKTFPAASGEPPVHDNTRAEQPRPLSKASRRWLGYVAPLVILAAAACASQEPAPASEQPDSVRSAPGETQTGPATVPLTRMGVERAFPTLSFREPVYLTYSDDGANRLFVVERAGVIAVFDDDETVTSADTFLDIRQRVNDAGREEGLLGMAFDPQYATNGYFYVYYSASDPRRSVLSRFSVSATSPDLADPNSELVIMQVPQPFKNHNGGHLAFGPDGYLYIGLGDGGSGGDPHGNGQNTATLLGSVLRIDVSAASLERPYRVPPDNPFAGMSRARGEIWAYGLRNPWRFAFDRETGDLWAADVGQNRYEEIDIIRPGLNYGWNIMEGSQCYPRGDLSCAQEGLEPPIIDYGHRDGCSVTGGYLYRGLRLPSLRGAYVYGDFCSGKIWALRYDGSRVTEHLEIADSGPHISSFGEDQAGELYILAFDEGYIYRLR